MTDNPKHRSPARLTSAGLTESIKYEFMRREFYFLFPLKIPTEYTLSFYYADTVTSTNDKALMLPAPGMKEIKVLCATTQTAGRGRGEHKWESESGKNLTFSIICRADFLSTADQFLLLQAGALAVRHVLGKLMRQVSIKWPNDIYIGDSKVSGTLIQLDVAGESIRRAVIGVGLNVNQETFRSDAPNPVSLINVLGHETELRPLLRQITERFAMEYDCLRDDKEFIRSRYLQHLWRLEGKHPYRDKDGEFMAEVVRVENDGHLVLRDAQGRERSYAFGEVDAVL